MVHIYDKPSSGIHSKHRYKKEGKPTFMRLQYKIEHILISRYMYMCIIYYIYIVFSTISTISYK